MRSASGFLQGRITSRDRCGSMIYPLCYSLHTSLVGAGEICGWTRRFPLSLKYSPFRVFCYADAFPGQRSHYHIPSAVYTDTEGHRHLKTQYKRVCSRCSPNISFGISWDNSLERMTSMFDCQEKLDIGHCCGIKGRWADYLSPKASAGHRIFLGGPYALLGLVRSKHYGSLGETNFKLFCP